MDEKTNPLPPGDGPVIDMEPIAENGASGQQRQAWRARVRLPKPTLFAAAGLASLLLAAVAGAYVYGAFGFGFFGNGAADEIAALNERVATLEQASGDQATQRQAIADKLDAMSQAVDGLAAGPAKLSALETRMAALASAVEALQAKPAGKAADADALKKLQAQVEALSAKLAGTAALSPAIANLARNFTDGKALGPDLDQVADADLRAALEPFRNDAPAGRAALSRELQDIAASLQGSPLVPAADDNSYSAWIAAFFGRFFTIRPAGSALAAQMALFAEAQDVAAAAGLLQSRADAPEALRAWQAKAAVWLKADDAVRRLKLGAT